MSRDILDAMTVLAKEKGIAPEKLRLALEDALLSAYKKQPDRAKYARVELDPETADFRVIELIIPERLEAHLIVETIDEGTTYDPETGEMVEPQDPEIDPAKFEEYKDQITEQDVTPGDFGRIAAQTAKQVILQRIREAERDMMFEEYRDRVGELITGIVQQSDSRYTLVQLRERVEALLPKSEQVEGERYDHSQRVKAVIKEVSPSTKGPSIIVSRRDPELIKKLFELEVPEIADGLVEIANVAREPGYRSKIAVVSHADGVDPVGACVGPRGSRVRMVVSELRGEKIDIIPYNDEPARFVAKALSPARVREVLVDDDGKQATVIVPDDQLSLAIGREGQNARLAARLTGWRIDIKSESEFAAEEQESGYEEEETQGRCAAVMSTGRRCPNAALPGSRYCGLDSHQALANQPTDEIARRRGRLARTRARPSRADAGADGVVVARRGARPRTRCRRPPSRRRPHSRRAAALRGLRHAGGEGRSAARRARRRARRGRPRAAPPGPRRLRLRPRVRGARAAARRLPALVSLGGASRSRPRKLNRLMAKVRVHELAKAHDMSSQDVLAKLRARRHRGQGARLGRRRRPGDGRDRGPAAADQRRRQGGRQGRRAAAAAGPDDPPRPAAAARDLRPPAAVRAAREPGRQARAGQRRPAARAAPRAAAAAARRPPPRRPPAADGTRSRRRARQAAPDALVAVGRARARRARPRWPAPRRHRLAGLAPHARPAAAAAAPPAPRAPPPRHVRRHGRPARRGGRDAHRSRSRELRLDRQGHRRVDGRARCPRSSRSS